MYWSPLGESGKYGTYAISTVDTPNYGRIAVYRSSGDNSGFRDQWFPFEGIEKGWFVKPSAPARWMLCTPEASRYDPDDDIARFFHRMGCNEELITAIAEWTSLPDELQYGSLVDPSEIIEPWKEQWNADYASTKAKLAEVEREIGNNKRQRKDDVFRLEHQLKSMQRSPVTSMEAFSRINEEMNEIRDSIEALKDYNDPRVYETLVLHDKLDELREFHEENAISPFNRALTLMGWERDPATVNWLEKRRNKL